MRARYPDTEGYVERDGVRIFYEVFGEGEPTVLLLPSWSDHPLTLLEGAGTLSRTSLSRHHLRRARQWQIESPARSGGLHRGIRRGCSGGAGCERNAAGCAGLAFDGRAVGASARRRACGSCRGSRVHRRVAADSAPIEARVVNSFDDVLATDEGWAKYNRQYWLKDYRGFLEFFFAQCFNEPHSTKQIEDCVGWGLETTPELLIATAEAEPAHGDEKSVYELAGQVCCPVLVIHGDSDAITRTRGVWRSPG